MIVELATLENLPQIRQIADNTWPVTYQELLTREQIDYMMNMMYGYDSLTRQMTEQNHHFFIIKSESSDHYQGFVSYEYNYKDSAKTKIHKLYVLPECQGMGMGRILINKVAEAARSKANSTLTLNMNRDNKTKLFYEYIGFVIVGEEDIDIGNGFLMKDYIFEKRL